MACGGIICSSIVYYELFIASTQFLFVNKRYLIHHPFVSLTRGTEGTEGLKRGFLLIARNQSAKRILAEACSI